MTLKRISIYLLLFVAVMTLSAHRFPYPTRIVDGQEMYEYPVQKGEGLYRISVTFGVSQEELIKYNPELSTSGLKFGQTILVPVKETHVIQSGETLYRIAKKHNMTVEQLKVLNPEVNESSLRIGSILRLSPAEGRPGMKAVPQRAEPDAPAKGEEREVEMPKPSVAVAEPEPEPEPEPVEENHNITTTTPLENAAPEQPAEPKPEIVENLLLEEMPVLGDTFRLALLLPLQADAQTYDVKMERFLKFYEGVLLALREDKREDVKLEVFVYDVGKTEYKLRKVLDSPEMQRIHAMIGPAYSEQVPLASMFAKTHRVPCLLPFTNDVDSLDSNPFLLQNNPEVPEGTKVVQFKREKNNEWAAFDEQMRLYFNVTTPSTARPRYDILGYDLAKYFVPAVLKAMNAETEEEWQGAFLTEYDGLQSTLSFRRVGEGGFVNTPIRVVKRMIVNTEETE